MKGKKQDFSPANVQKDATAITRKANAAWYKKLDFTDESEKENALRGLIEAPTGFVIRGDDGHIIWDVASYDFLKHLNSGFRGIFQPDPCWCGGITEFQRTMGLLTACDIPVAVHASCVPLTAQLVCSL